MTHVLLDIIRLEMKYNRGALKAHLTPNIQAHFLEHRYTWALGSVPFIGNSKGKKKDTSSAAPALEPTFRNNEVLLTQVVKAIKMKKSYANVVVA